MLKVFPFQTRYLFTGDIYELTETWFEDQQPQWVLNLIGEIKR
jgi:hypothetical protein